MHNGAIDAGFVHSADCIFDQKGGGLMGRPRVPRAPKVYLCVDDRHLAFHKIV
jgi:hypothetical protein